MEDNDETQDKTSQPSVEGVRLIGKDEADAAIRAGEAVNRRTANRQQASTAVPLDGLGKENGLEKENVIRFPVSATSDESDVQRPSLTVRSASPVVIENEDDQIIDLRVTTGDDEGSTSQDVKASQNATIGQSSTGSRNAIASPNDISRNDVHSGNSPSLPHWTEPPTGEMILQAGDHGEGSGPRWRDDNSSWSDDDLSLDLLSEASGLGSAEIEDGKAEDEDLRLLTTSHHGESSHRGESSELSNDDDDVPAFLKGEESNGSLGNSKDGKTGTRFREQESKRILKERAYALATKSLATRVATGLLFGLIAIAAFSAGPAFTLALASAIVILASVEFFDALRRVGYRPATLLALIAIGGVMLGAYARGEQAIGLVAVLTLFFTFLWYQTGIIKGQPTANIAVTMLGFVWPGVLGAYAALLLRMPEHHGMAFLLVAVACTIAYDTFAYLGGNIVGRKALAPHISPGKTWEGLIVGTIGSLVVGAIAGQAIHPWSLGSGLLLGAAIAVVAPLGDLAESMVKRDLGMKDMGHLLPGHGGVFDRFDALFFVLPTTYYLVQVLNIG